jgi:methionine biosynthesis protein MetW
MFLASKGGVSDTAQNLVATEPQVTTLSSKGSVAGKDGHFPQARGRLIKPGGAVEAKSAQDSPARWAPDDSARGFLPNPADPLRYDGQPNEPDEVVGVLSSLIPNGSRILDVGCGTGSVSVQVAANTGSRVVGVEPDPDRASRARMRGLDVHQALLSEDLIATLGQFDIVMFADVLEHLPDPLAVLRISRAALAPSGAIVASVPNVAHWSVRSDLLRGRFEYREWGIMDATHLRWFTAASLRLLIASADMTVEAQRVTAGVDLQCYSERLPWRRFSRPTRASVIRRAIKHWPLLFGCQLVIRAVSPVRVRTAA